MTIVLTQKEFDLLDEVAKFEVVNDVYLTKAHNNGALAKLVEQELVATRPSAKSKLQVEVAILDLGLKVVNNEVEHEIVASHTQEAVADTTETANTGEVAEVADFTQPHPTGTVNTSMFTLEDNIPIPEITATRTPRKTMFPLAQMAIGQSFFVPHKEGTTDVEQSLKNVRSKVSQTKRSLWGKDSGKAFVTALENGGVRVWRKA